MDEFTKLMAEYRSDVEYEKSDWARLTRHVLGKLENFLELPINAPSLLEDYVGENTRFESRASIPSPAG